MFIALFDMKWFLYALFCASFYNHILDLCAFYINFKTSSLTPVVILINVPALINYPRCFFDKMREGTDGLKWAYIALLAMCSAFVFGRDDVC